MFRLAHDVCVSGFGNRQALYERFSLDRQPSWRLDTLTCTTANPMLIV